MDLGRTVPAHFDAWTWSPLDINGNIRWSDLKGTEGIRPVIIDRDFVIAMVAPPPRWSRWRPRPRGPRRRRPRRRALLRRRRARPVAASLAPAARRRRPPAPAKGGARDGAKKKVAVYGSWRTLAPPRPFLPARGGGEGLLVARTFQPMLLWVGLGNPGARDGAAAPTNIGFMALDAIAMHSSVLAVAPAVQGCVVAEGEASVGPSCIGIEAVDLHERSWRERAGGGSVLQTGAGARSPRSMTSSTWCRAKCGSMRGGGSAGHSHRAEQRWTGCSARRIIGVRVRLGIGHPGVKEQVNAGTCSAISARVTASG